MTAPTCHTGHKVRLRPLRRGDAEQTLAWRNDPSIRDPQLGHRFPVTAEMEAAWFEQRLNDRSGQACIMAIEDLTDNAFVGYIQLTDIDWVSRTAELGISIGAADRHGQGLGRESLDLMLRHAFTVLNLNRIWVRVADFNRAAQRLFDGAGFTAEGRLRHHVFVDGAYHDLLMMGLLRAQTNDGDG